VAAVKTTAPEIRDKLALERLLIFDQLRVKYHFAGKGMIRQDPPAEAVNGINGRFVVACQRLIQGTDDFRALFVFRKLREQVRRQWVRQSVLCLFAHHGLPGFDDGSADPSAQFGGRPLV
jgi:hypothetical protein